MKYLNSSEADFNSIFPTTENRPANKLNRNEMNSLSLSLLPLPNIMRFIDFVRLDCGHIKIELKKCIFLSLLSCQLLALFGHSLGLMFLENCSDWKMFSKGNKFTSEKRLTKIGRKTRRCKQVNFEFWLRIFFSTWFSFFSIIILRYETERVENKFFFSFSLGLGIIYRCAMILFSVFLFYIEKKNIFFDSEKKRCERKLLKQFAKWKFVVVF